MELSSNKSVSKNYKNEIELMFGTYKYDYIMPFFQNYTIAVLNNKAGLIDTMTGEPITDFIYDDLSKDDCSEYDLNLNYENCNIWNCDEKYCHIRLNNKWGMLNSKGQTVIDFNFDNDFLAFENNKYICAQKNNKWGVVDNNFDTLIEFKYDNLNYVENNIFEACIDNKWGIINIKNEVLVDFIYNSLSTYNNLAIAKYDSKYGIIDLEGNIIQDFKYNTLLYSWFVNKKQAVFLKDKTVDYINTNGEIDFSIDFNKFDNITHYPLEDKFCCIEKDKKFGITDIKGNIILEPKYESISVFKENFIVNENIIVNKKGELIKKTEFKYILPNNNYAIAYSNNKVGVIDKTGKILIECQYNSLFPDINETFLIAEKGGYQGIVDLNNSVILDFIYDSIEVCYCESKKDVRFIVEINKKYALLDEKGKRLA